MCVISCRLFSEIHYFSLDWSNTPDFTFCLDHSCKYQSLKTSAITPIIIL